MRYGILITLSIFLLLEMIVVEFDLTSWLWFSSPVIIAFLIELGHLKNPKISRAIPITMLALFPLGLFVYLSEIFSETTDAQAGLLSAIMPLYQLIIIVLIIFASIIKHALTTKPKDA